MGILCLARDFELTIPPKALGFGAFRLDSGSAWNFSEFPPDCVIF